MLPKIMLIQDEIDFIRYLFFIITKNETATYCRKQCTLECNELCKHGITFKICKNIKYYTNLTFFGKIVQNNAVFGKNMREIVKTSKNRQKMPQRKTVTASV